MCETHETHAQRRARATRSNTTRYKKFHHATKRARRLHVCAYNATQRNNARDARRNEKNMMTTNNNNAMIDVHNMMIDAIDEFVTMIDAIDAHDAYTFDAIDVIDVATSNAYNAHDAHNVDCDTLCNMMIVTL